MEDRKMDVQDLSEAELGIRNGAPCVVEVQGKTYKILQISNAVRRRISDLEKEAFFLEKKAKDGLTLKEAKRIDRKIRTLHSKTAAYYLLGNWAIFIRPLWAIKWRLLDLKDSEVTYSINAMGANNRGVDFFLANWQITKVQLALSTRLVGKGIKQYEERMESAEGMLREDGLETSQDSK